MTHRNHHSGTDFACLCSLGFKKGWEISYFFSFPMSLRLTSSTICSIASWVRLERGLLHFLLFSFPFIWFRWWVPVRIIISSTGPWFRPPCGGRLMDFPFLCVEVGPEEYFLSLWHLPLFSKDSLSLRAQVWIPRRGSDTYTHDLHFILTPSPLLFPTTLK